MTSVSIIKVPKREFNCVFLQPQSYKIRKRIHNKAIKKKSLSHIFVDFPCLINKYTKQYAANHICVTGEQNLRIQQDLNPGTPASPQPMDADVMLFCLSDVFFPLFPATLKYNWVTFR